MKISHLLMAMLVLMVTATTLQAAPRPPTEKQPAGVEAKLDALLKRLDVMEKRISKLEQAVEEATKRHKLGSRILPWPDRNGLLRDVNGRVIGIWGTDAIPNSDIQMRQR